jgi:hypothetical protein
MKRQFMFGTVMAAALTVGIGAQSTTPQSSKPYGSTSTQEKSTGMHETGRGQMVTLVGCLQSGDQSASGTSGAATGGAASAAGSTPPSGTMSASGDRSRSTSNRGTMGTQFVLTDATQSSTEKGGGAATGTSGATAGSAVSGSIPSRLQLMASGNSSANWSRYLNHRVEVKGTLNDAMGGSESNTANPSSTNPSSTNPSTTSPSTTPPSTNPANPAGIQPSQGTGAGTMSSGGMGGAMFHVTSIKEVSGTCSGSSIK